MVNLTERLVFGCARLTGGASAREARNLLDSAYAAGIRHFDTAPSYGLGTAEFVVGAGLRSFDEPVMVTAKLGSVRPRHAGVQTWLRRAKRLLAPDGDQRLAGYHPLLAANVVLSGDFAPDAMRRSLDLSLKRLGRIDWLLLHEAYGRDRSEELVAQVTELGAQVGARIGYSNGALFDARADGAWPPDWIGQTAVDPAWLIGTPPPARSAPLALHSLALMGEHLARTDRTFAVAREKAAALIGHTSQGARIAATIALAAHRLPGAQLIVASSNVGRLADLLGCITRIDAEGLMPEIAASFKC